MLCCSTTDLKFTVACNHRAYGLVHEDLEIFHPLYEVQL